MLLLVDCGAYTWGVDIPDYQDILRMQDRWKKYRKLVIDESFFNDSVVVLADYSNADKDAEMNTDDSKISVVSNYPEIESENSKNESAIHREYVDDEKDGGEIVKVGVYNSSMLN